MIMVWWFNLVFKGGLFDGVGYEFLDILRLLRCVLTGLYEGGCLGASRLCYGFLRVLGGF